MTYGPDGSTSLPKFQISQNKSEIEILFSSDQVILTFWSVSNFLLARTSHYLIMDVVVAVVPKANKANPVPVRAYFI